MSITFTTFLNADWKEKIESEIVRYLESYAQLQTIQSNNIFAFHELQLVGGVIYQTFKESVWVESIWVEERFRRQGIGKMLIEEVCGASNKNSIKMIQSNTYFPEGREFFKRCGFLEIGNIPEWKYGLTCYLMKKSL